MKPKLMEYSDFIAKNMAKIAANDRDTTEEAFRLAEEAAKEAGKDITELSHEWMQKTGGKLDEEILAKVDADGEKNPERSAAFRELVAFRRANAYAIVRKRNPEMLEFAKMVVKCARLNGSDPDEICPDALKWVLEHQAPSKTVKLCPEVLEALRDADSKTVAHDRIVEKGNAVKAKIAALEAEIEKLAEDLEAEEEKLAPHNEKLWAAVNVYMGYSQSVHGYMRIKRETKELELFEDIP